VSADDFRPPCVQIPRPIRRLGKALLYSSIALWILASAGLWSFPTVNIPGTDVSIAAVFMDLFFVNLGILAFLAGFLVLYAMRIATKNAAQKAAIAGHNRLAALASVGYAITFAGAAPLMFLFVFSCVAATGPQLDTRFINVAPVWGAIGQILFYLGWILGAIGFIIAIVPIWLVLSGFEPKQVFLNFLKAIIEVRQNR
jgi:hypothetical protein